MEHQETVSNKQKRLLIPSYVKIFVILLFIFVVIGVYLILRMNDKKVQKAVSTLPSSVTLNTPPPTTEDVAPISQAQIDSWPYYIDQKDGYMIKHPSYITFNGEEYYFIGDDNRLDSPDGVGARVEIQVQTGQDLPVGSNSLLQQKKVTINNARGIQNNLNGKLYNMFLVPQNGEKKLVEIYFQTDPPSINSSQSEKFRSAKMYAIGKAMVATFKFFGQKVPTNTLTSTFVNKKYGYSLQYPITWGYTDSNTTQNPNVIDMTGILFGEPRLIGALYVQDNLKTIGSPVSTEFSVSVEKPTDHDKDMLDKNINCGVTGKPYQFKNATGVIFENTGCGLAGGVTFINILYNGYFYTIQTTMDRSVLDPILKTFTFLD